MKKKSTRVAVMVTPSCKCAPEPPDEFICPLTHDCMRDPVLLHTSVGRSYERAALEEHLRRRPHHDPFSSKKHSQRLDFTPERNLKSIIEAWLREHNITLEPREPLSAHDAATQLVAAQDAGTRNRTARALAGFCRNNMKRPVDEEDEDDSKVAARPAIPVLVAMLGSDDQAEAGVHTLWMLSRNDQNDAIVDAGAIPPLVALLTSENGKVCGKAAVALWSIAMGSNRNTTAIVEAGGIQLLVNLLSGTDMVKFIASITLATLAINDRIRIAIAKAGAIPPLVALLTSGNHRRQEKAALALRNLTNTRNQTIIANAGALPPLVNLLTSGTDKAKKYAADAVVRLATNPSNKAAILALITNKKPPVSPLVTLLTSSDIDPTKKRAVGYAIVDALSS